MEDTIDAVWGKLMGTSGVPIFSCLRSIVYRWVFAPDTMHPLDENTPRLYLAHWMGVYRDKEIAALSQMQSKTLPGDNRADVGQSQAQSQTQADSQAESQFESQVESQFETQVESQKASEGWPGPHSQVVSGLGECSRTGARINRQSKRRRGRQGINFNTNVDHNRDREVERDSYALSKKIWDKIGAEIADSRCTIPSAFGKAFRDIKYHASYKATELMNFMHLISPVMLNQRLPAQYYDH
ncbi:uncharacterized protein LAJ45_02971 [Morchella importuna]|uniref:uncharacterized protein n=1 Tax=Morchella importuna TaxID=1174673 RepID=UPI001E8D03AC|nr:uncharacterized protein LAJ45_02971 [Morchella importuna]KAH8152747.1 hypothetical protein LAJ45_02971 [Morchella importuna]